MGVEGCGLVRLGQADPHLVSERREVRRRDLPVAVLDAVEMLDQEVAAARLVTEERLDLLERCRLDLPPLRLGAAAIAPSHGAPIAAETAVPSCGPPTPP
jgi:hypothetical protein